MAQQLALDHAASALATPSILKVHAQKCNFYRKREEKMAAAAAAREAAERERRAAMEAAARERMEKQHHADLGKLERLKEVERVT